MKKLLHTTAAIAIISIAIACLSIMQTLPATYAAPADWQLIITGLVDHPLTLNLTEIISMPSTTENAVLYCVDQPSIPRAQGNWTGVTLRGILEKAGVQNATVKVAFYAADGYTTDLPIQRAMQDEVIVAYSLNGNPLMENLRLVTPDQWGYKWIAQITRIELVDYDYLGLWESNGYPDQADALAPATPNRYSFYNPSFPPPPSFTPTDAPNTPTSIPSPLPTATPTSAPLSSAPTSPSPSPTLTGTQINRPTPSSTQQPVTGTGASTENPPNSSATLIVAILGAAVAAALAASAFILKRRSGNRRIP
ncbi:MAG: molybdopterin-dependent oxidoreductase [Candidatus Bathyarchaeia archaeon]